MDFITHYLFLQRNPYRSLQIFTKRTDKPSGNLYPFLQRLLETRKSSEDPSNLT